MASRSIVGVIDIRATGAIVSQSLNTDTIYPVNDNILYRSSTNVTLLDIGFNGGYKGLEEYLFK